MAKDWKMLGQGLHHGRVRLVRRNGPAFSPGSGNNSQRFRKRRNRRTMAARCVRKWDGDGSFDFTFFSFSSNRVTFESFEMIYIWCKMLKNKAYSRLPPSTLKSHLLHYGFYFKSFLFIRLGWKNLIFHRELTVYCCGVKKNSNLFVRQ